MENKYLWQIYTLDGDEVGTIEHEKLLSEVGCTDVVKTIIQTYPQLDGVSFAVSDDDREFLFKSWGADRIYDVYEHNPYKTVILDE